MLCFSFWGDRLVLRPSRKRKDIADIQSWSQAFPIFTLVLTSYFPHQSSDLLRYQLIILRSQQQFGGVAWLNYDRAFRCEDAALRLGDWPHHFHTRTGVASASSLSTSPIDTSGEARGTLTSTFLCRSWNLGQCSSQFRRCRFRHSCDFPGCNEMHCRTRRHSSSSVPPTDLKNRTGSSNSYVARGEKWSPRNSIGAILEWPVLCFWLQ